MQVNNAHARVTIAQCWTKFKGCLLSVRRLDVTKSKILLQWWTWKTISRAQQVKPLIDKMYSMMEWLSWLTVTWLPAKKPSLCFAQEVADFIRDNVAKRSLRDGGLVLTGSSGNSMPCATVTFRCHKLLGVLWRARSEQTLGFCEVEALLINGINKSIVRVFCEFWYNYFYIFNFLNVIFILKII